MTFEETRDPLAALALCDEERLARVELEACTQPRHRAHPPLATRRARTRPLSKQKEPSDVHEQTEHRHLRSKKRAAAYGCGRQRQAMAAPRKAAVACVRATAMKARRACCSRPVHKHRCEQDVHK
eukprot:388232-Pleurochrysis_carterae.AAC.1